MAETASPLLGCVVVLLAAFTSLPAAACVAGLGLCAGLVIAGQLVVSVHDPLSPEWSTRHKAGYLAEQCRRAGIAPAAWVSARRALLLSALILWLAFVAAFAVRVLLIILTAVT